MSSANSSPLKYRTDVDGLRAVAVLAVLFFHSGMGFPGGYVGVDVFFVISGYLITGLILKDLDRGQFQIVEFWERRVRRILPALALVVLCTLVAGWFLFLAYDFKALAKSVLAQAVLLSNVYFWRDSGYFAQSAELKPLLHTWSLAVEEQFYLFFPFLLIALKRFSRKMLLFALILLCAVSFCLSVYSSYKYPFANFYLLPPRAWELLMGSFLAALPAQRILGRWITESLSAAGLLAILYAVFCYGPGTRFPGVAAILPCFGVASIIWANTHAMTAIGKCLSVRPVVFVGLISYSLYLWHWPVLVFSKYWVIDDIPLLNRILILAGTMVAATLSWRFVEMPFRQRLVFKPRPQIFRFAATSMALFFVAGLAVSKMEGVPSRLPKSVRAIPVYTPEELERQFSSSNLSLDQIRKGDLLDLGNGDRQHKISLCVWGDSHGMAMKPVLDIMCKERSVRGVAATHSGWAPLLDYESSGQVGSRLFSAEVAEFIRRNRVSDVLLVARWNSYIIRDNGTERLRRGLLATVKALEDSGARIWIMRQVPAHRLNSSKVLVSAVLSGRDREELGLSLAEHRKASEREDELFDGIALPDVTVINPTGLFVISNKLCRVAKEGQALYFDGDHLTPHGSLVLRPLLDPIFGGLRGNQASVGSKSANY